MKSFFETLQQAALSLAALLGTLLVIGVIFAPEYTAQRVTAAHERFFSQLPFTGAFKFAGLEIKTGELSGDIEATSATLQDLQNRVAALEAQLAPPPPAPIVVAPEPGEGGGGGGARDEPAPAPAPYYAQWIVYAGSEPVLSGQQVELARLRAEGIENSAILKIGRRYRTVAIYPDEAAAQAAVPVIAGIVGEAREPYARALSAVCPAWPRLELPPPEPFYDCS
ncbi:hypothetical protein ACQ5SO_06370 [Rhodovulum sp. DZ06]|uniref:hypothetical protein n=1 Tax=Rhodovulum sp. DZ06 TaxID=3425126 RepID=UPI003D3558DB